ncbi:unnamed protein product [Protopolystoma xenopodis]|uniref:EIF-2B GDP-GTP exchange factor subunit alpha n=1 Tax=Protopolystoma xenopodis TaxID=117903 RepID=A0A3S4ZSH6_9PLAT|nr:unnamed protein product [Protopolystoma xenopodis]
MTHSYLQSSVAACREQIAENALPLIPAGSRLLVHSRSRCVLTVLRAAAARMPGLTCLITESRPENSGLQMFRELTASLPAPSCQLIPDAAVAYFMPQVDAVLLGAEAVVESGGVLNRLGSATVAIVAAECGKPLYVMAESFKFLRCFPLDQLHIPDHFKWPHSAKRSSAKQDSQLSALTPSSGDLGISADSESQHFTTKSEVNFKEASDAWERVIKLRGLEAVEHKLLLPVVDYTSPQFVTFLVTDLGVLTPSAVSDELIKLYL